MQAGTLGMLVHGAGGRPHTGVGTRSHSHALHLSIAWVVRHALLMHAFHRLRGQRTIHHNQNLKSSDNLIYDYIYDSVTEHIEWLIISYKMKRYTCMWYTI